jgi:hypothetical protein
MLEKRVPLGVASDIMGWSASTMAKVEERYGHTDNQERRAAIDALSSAARWDRERAQRRTQSTREEKCERAETP